MAFVPSSPAPSPVHLAGQEKLGQIRQQAAVPSLGLCLQPLLPGSASCAELLGHPPELILIRVLIVHHAAVILHPVAQLLHLRPQPPGTVRAQIQKPLMVFLAPCSPRFSENGYAM